MARGRCQAVPRDATNISARAGARANCWGPPTWENGAKNHPTTGLANQGNVTGTCRRSVVELLKGFQAHPVSTQMMHGKAANQPRQVKPQMHCKTISPIVCSSSPKL
jgi:hypothetical protein